jgi:hypothetical protein
MASTSKIPLRQFSLTNPFVLAGKFGAACALALLSSVALGIPDLVTAAFVAVLCCSPGALMGLRTSFEQLAGSVLGGGLGTMAVILDLPQLLGVPLAVTLAVLATHLVGFYRGAIAASFTALFVQIVTFGDPLHTFGYRLEAVGVAALSAFIVNVAISAFFYRSLFAKRLGRVSARVDELVARAAVDGPAVMFPIFAAMSQVDEELQQALDELSWRRNDVTAAVLEEMRAELLWLRDYVHLIVNLEMGESEASPEVLAFISWLANEDGDAPELSGERSATRARLLQMLLDPPGVRGGVSP